MRTGASTKGYIVVAAYGVASVVVHSALQAVLCVLPLKHRFLQSVVRLARSLRTPFFNIYSILKINLIFLSY